MTTTNMTSLAATTQFSSVEMQAIVAATTIANIACAGLTANVQRLCARSMFGRALDIAVLKSKLTQLEWPEKVEMASKLDRLLDRQPGDCFSGRVPSRNALAAFGLLEPQGSPAWGFAVAVSSTRFYELVLRGEPLNQPLANLPLAELVEAAHLILSSEPFSEEDRNMLAAVLGAIAEQSGWRHFRVVQFGEKAPKLVQIKPRELLRDLDDGSLERVVLEGINAPLPDGGVLI